MVDGEKSEPVKVDSRVLQGSVLWPLTFLLHNDLPDIVTSVIHLFADNCLVYKIIRTI